MFFPYWNCQQLNVNTQFEAKPVLLAIYNYIYMAISGYIISYINWYLSHDITIMLVNPSNWYKPGNLQPIVQQIVCFRCSMISPFQLVIIVLVTIGYISRNYVCIDIDIDWYIYISIGCVRHHNISHKWLLILLLIGLYNVQLNQYNLTPAFHSCQLQFNGIQCAVGKTLIQYPIIPSFHYSININHPFLIWNSKWFHQCNSSRFHQCILWWTNIAMENHHF